VAYAQLRCVVPAQQPIERVEADTAQLIASTEEVVGNEIFFVLNDSVVYTTLQEFKSTSAQTKYQEWVALQKQQQHDTQQLVALREQYSQADEEARKKMAPTILHLEQLLSQYNAQSARLIRSCRELETQAYQQ
jgi:flagellar motility protein MotE (MotC chaperone)